MQRSAFIIALFSLFAFFSLALASPLPVQVSKELREATVELGARGVPVDYKVSHREAAAVPGVGLDILAREHDNSQGETDDTNVARDTQELEPRICPARGCA